MSAASVPEVTLSIGAFTFPGRFERQSAPKAVAWLIKRLPLQGTALQARWSGEAAWIPLGGFRLDVGFENHTSHPSVGDILFYPGGYSETEILLAYGACSFASRMGPLAGNHFLTIVEGREQLKALGHRVLWEGAQDVLFTLEADSPHE